MSKSLQIIDYTVDAGSASYGLANIQTVLGIVLLVLSIISILFKCVLSIYTHIKNKEIDKISESFDISIQTLEEKVKELKELENNKNE